jgi:hypothetical protein
VRLRGSPLIVFVLVGLMGMSDAGAVAPSRHPMAPSAKTPEQALSRAPGRIDAPNPGQGMLADNFKLVGHTDLGATDLNGDVWVHGDFAYVGTYADPCNGLGVKVIDVSNPAEPTMIGRVARIRGTHADDVVVRSVSTPGFTGDLLATGIQDCIDDPPADEPTFGLDLWDVTEPATPVHLGQLPISTGGDADGVHELDMVQRGQSVYVLATTPWEEWVDPVEMDADLYVIDVTDPTQPAIVGGWGAGQEGLSPGPAYGQGSFGAMFGHSARASADGKTAYVSYWDLGVVTLDISDPTSPTFVGYTNFPADAEGNAHSVVPYSVGGRDFLLQNDEDWDPRGSASVIVAGIDIGVASESQDTPALALEPHGQISGRVARPARQGCEKADYEGIRTEGRIALVKTYLSFGDERQPACRQRAQDRVAARLGAALVLHDWISQDTSPQWWDSSDVRIPVLFTDHHTARQIVSDGRAKLVAGEPSWGFLRVFDADTGEQVATFDDLPYVHKLRSPPGYWMIQNTEVRGDMAYSSWLSHGVVALDLSPLAKATPGDPVLAGQFVPRGSPNPPSEEVAPYVANVWGVFVRESDGLVFLSDMASGLWIVRPTGPAA